MDMSVVEKMSLPDLRRPNYGIVAIKILVEIPL
jgi:hypothetical protein